MRDNEFLESVKIVKAEEGREDMRSYVKRIASDSGGSGEVHITERKDCSETAAREGFV